MTYRVLIHIRPLYKMVYGMDKVSLLNSCGFSLNSQRQTDRISFGKQKRQSYQLNKHETTSDTFNASYLSDLPESGLSFELSKKSNISFKGGDLSTLARRILEIPLETLTKLDFTRIPSFGPKATCDIEGLVNQALIKKTLGDLSEPLKPVLETITQREKEAANVIKKLDRMGVSTQYIQRNYTDGGISDIDKRVKIRQAIEKIKSQGLPKWKEEAEIRQIKFDMSFAGQEGSADAVSHKAGAAEVVSHKAAVADALSAKTDVVDALTTKADATEALSSISDAIGHKSLIADILDYLSHL
jgi:hypothetical protein